MPPAPSLGRRSRWALLGAFSLLAGMVLLPPAPAQAQAVHVTNLGQSTNGSQSYTSAIARATSFRTGGTATDRFRLNNVVINISSGANDTEVSIHQDSSGSPGTKIGSDLTRGNTSSGNTTYTASGITLNGNTTYWLNLLHDGATGTSGTVRTTTSNAQTGGTNWQIGDNTLGFITSWSEASTESIRFRVNATTLSTLTAGMITATSARITIGNHTGAWYYKKTSPTPAGSCTSRTSSQTYADLTSLTGNTSYTYKAYSDSSCTTEIASATFTTLPAPPTGFAGGSSTSYGYGSGSNPTTNISSSGQSRTFNKSFLLRGEYSAINSSQRLTCATGTMLEYGWYRSSAPKTRVGTGSVASRGGATVYRGDYTPTFSSDYQFLAY